MVYIKRRLTLNCIDWFSMVSVDCMKNPNESLNVNVIAVKKTAFEIDRKKIHWLKKEACSMFTHKFMNHHRNISLHPWQLFSLCCVHSLKTKRSYLHLILDIFFFRCVKHKARFTVGLFILGKYDLILKKMIKLNYLCTNSRCETLCWVIHIGNIHGMSDPVFDYYYMYLYVVWVICVLFRCRCVFICYVMLFPISKVWCVCVRESKRTSRTMKTTDKKKRAKQFITAAAFEYCRQQSKMTILCIYTSIQRARNCMYACLVLLMKIVCAQRGLYTGI